MEKKELPLLGAAIAVGMIGAGFLVGHAITGMQSANRYVTVRGLAEQDAKANLAVWTLKFKTTGDDLVSTQASLDTQKDAIMKFLTEEGFTAEEIKAQGVRVVDKQANEYGGADAAAGKRFVLSSAIMLRSEKIDEVMKAHQQMSKLVTAGVVLSDDNYCGNSPSYLFTKLNDVKIEMLASATKNAREAAGQFAKDAGAQVGSIRQASQGYFSISARDKVQESSGGDNGCGDSDSVMKKIRVVSTIDYYLE